jgi:hypothetical protein
MFFRAVDGATYSYPIPTHKPELNDCYVKGARKKLKLAKEDGITDEDFFSRA